MKTKKLDHLAKIYNEYDAFIIDLWGVMHNGIKLNSSAINAVKELDEKVKKLFFYLTHLAQQNKLLSF